MTLKQTALFTALLHCFSLVAFGQLGDVGFRENTLILKVSAEFEANCFVDNIDAAALNQVKDMLGASEIKQKFPQSKRPSANESSAKAPQLHKSEEVDIRLIYEWKYANEVPVFKAINALLQTGVFDYVEPAYIPKLAFVPSDELASSQYHLEQIRAFEAFSVDSGSSDITIAIIDTGVDWDHPDLEASVRTNEADLFDGLDNDSNGYVDDFRGWNFFDNNNDPNETSWSHGTHVAGLSSAVTNNDIGVVGTGYRCKLLPIKSGSFLELPFGYEGIVYAAENDAEVINCSWGNPGYSEFAHDVVKYATYNHDALLIGAAGNDNEDRDFFPASYPEVMSVAASDSLYHRADFSNYTYAVDILAPGKFILSTKNDTFNIDNGTSMAAPIVAGAAGLVRNKFPDLTALQVLAHLKSTANDSIYSLDANKPYVDRLGGGLLDMRAALNDPVDPFLRIENVNITDNADEAFAVGDIVEVNLDVVNYLAPVSDITVRVESLDSLGQVELLSDTWAAGSFASLETKNNESNTFSFEILEGEGAYNRTVSFRVEIANGSYTTYNYFKVEINPDYINVAVNNIRSSVSSDGSFGFTNFTLSRGLGVQYLDRGNLLYEGGLMIGYDNKGNERVVDRIRSSNGRDVDFGAQEVISLVDARADEAMHAIGSFNDEPAITDEIGLEIIQSVYAYDEPALSDYYVIAYQIINKSGVTLQNLHVGMFADWDIVNARRNKAQTVFSTRLGMVDHPESSLTAGVQLLSNIPFHSYMIDNSSDGSGGVVLNDEDRYTSEDKLLTLSTDRFVAGESENGGDVIQVISTQGMNLAHGDTALVKFAIHAGESAEQVMASARAAYQKEFGFIPGEQLENPFEISRLYPVPAVEEVTLDFELKTSQEVRFVFYDLMGKSLHAEASEQYFAGSNRAVFDTSFLPSGTYILAIETQDHSERIQFQKIEK